MRKILTVLISLIVVALISVIVISGATLGDVNLDGQVNIIDALVVAKYYLGNEELSESLGQIEAADVNRDSTINIIDALLIAQYSVGVINEFPNNSSNPEFDLVNANSEFAFEVFQKLNNEENRNNIFYSPLSVSIALSMLYQGADGQTKNEIAETLNYNGIDTSILNNDYKTLLTELENIDEFIDLNISNSLWVRDNFIVKESFMNTNKDIFGAEVRNLDFSQPDAAEILNGWIYDATNGMVTDMISPPIPPDVMLYLINAIYFKGSWTEPFNPDKTRESIFTNDNNKENTIDLMYMMYDIEFTKDDDCSAIRLPYGDEKVSIYFIMPTEGKSLDSFISTFSLKKFNNIKNSLVVNNYFEVGIPKFEMEYGTKSLKNILVSMGMEDSFGPLANFSGIAPDSGLYVEDVLHKAKINVNEEGTEAAAATVIPVPVSIRDNFFATRPFMFIIADDTKGTILFMGKAANLSK